MEETDEKREKRVRLRAAVINELKETERAYVKSLDVLNSAFIVPLMADVKFLAFQQKGSPRGDVKMLFSTVSLIKEANEQFLDRLEKDDQSVGKALSSLELDYYSVFCNHLTRATTDLEKMSRSSVECAALMECGRSPESGNLGLLDLLAKPFQRVLKYPLLLRELLKYTDSDHGDRVALESALNRLQTNVDTINKNKAKADNLQVMLEIHESLVGFPKGFQLVQPGRLFLRQGLVNKISGKHDQFRKIFLFNDLFVYSKKSKIHKDKFNVRGMIDVDKIEVEDTSDTGKLQNAIKLVRLDKNLTYFLYFSSVTEKQGWLQALQAAKRTYNVLALSTNKYNDKDEYAEVIGVVRLFYDADGTRVFKTFAVGTACRAQDLVGMLGQKLKIADVMTGSASPPLVLHRGPYVGHPTATERQLGDDECPLSIQLKLINEGVDFPSEENYFEVKLPAGMVDRLAKEMETSYQTLRRQTAAAVQSSKKHTMVEALLGRESDSNRRNTSPASPSANMAKDSPKPLPRTPRGTIIEPTVAATVADAAATTNDPAAELSEDLKLTMLNNLLAEKKSYRLSVGMEPTDDYQLDLDDDDLSEDEAAALAAVKSSAQPSALANSTTATASSTVDDDGSENDGSIGSKPRKLSSMPSPARQRRPVLVHQDSVSFFGAVRMKEPKQYALKTEKMKIMADAIENEPPGFAVAGSAAATGPAATAAALATVVKVTGEASAGDIPAEPKRKAPMSPKMERRRRQLKEQQESDSTSSNRSSGVNAVDLAAALSKAKVTPPTPEKKHVARSPRSPGGGRTLPSPPQSPRKKEQLPPQDGIEQQHQQHHQQQLAPDEVKGPVKKKSIPPSLPPKPDVADVDL